MQILELNTSTVDMQDTFNALDHIKYVTETGYLQRLFNKVFLGRPMTLNS